MLGVKSVSRSPKRSPQSKSPNSRSPSRSPTARAQNAKLPAAAYQQEVEDDVGAGEVLNALIAKHFRSTELRQLAQRVIVPSANNNNNERHETASNRVGSGKGSHRALTVKQTTPSQSARSGSRRKSTGHSEALLPNNMPPAAASSAAVTAAITSASTNRHHHSNSSQSQRNRSSSGGAVSSTNTTSSNRRARPGSFSSSAARRRSPQPQLKPQNTHHREGSSVSSYASPTAASFARASANTSTLDRNVPSNSAHIKQNNTSPKATSKAAPPYRANGGSVSLIHAASAAARRKAYDAARARSATLVKRKGTTKSLRAKTTSTASDSVNHNGSIGTSHSHAAASNNHNEIESLTKKPAVASVRVQTQTSEARQKVYDAFMNTQQEKESSTIAFSEMLRAKSKKQNGGTSSVTSVEKVIQQQQQQQQQRGEQQQQQQQQQQQRQQQGGGEGSDYDDEDWGDMDDVVIETAPTSGTGATATATAGTRLHTNRSATPMPTPTPIQMRTPIKGGDGNDGGHSPVDGGAGGGRRLIRPESAQSHGPILLEFRASPALADKETKVGEMVLDLANQRWVSTNESEEEDLMAGFGTSDEEEDDNDNNNNQNEEEKTLSAGATPEKSSSPINNKDLNPQAVSNSASTGPKLITLDMLAGINADNGGAGETDGGGGMEIGEDWDAGWSTDEDEDANVDINIDQEGRSVDSDGVDGGLREGGEGDRPSGVGDDAEFDMGAFSDDHDNDNGNDVASEAPKNKNTDRRRPTAARTTTSWASSSIGRLGKGTGARRDLVKLTASLSDEDVQALRAQAERHNSAIDNCDNVNGSSGKVVGVAPDDEWLLKMACEFSINVAKGYATYQRDMMDVE